VASPGLLPVCVLAGGLGTRLGEAVRDTPKPLLEVAGKPFIFHQLELLRSHGARRIVLCVGYLGERIEAAVGDGARLGLHVTYSYDGPEPLGTGGAVRQALPQLGEAFMVLYGDTFLRVDYPEVQRAFEASELPGLMTVLRNDGRWEASNAIYADGRVLRHDKHRPTPDMRWIDYGLGVLRAEALDFAAGDPDLAGTYAELARRGLLAGYEASERFYEIGTSESLLETDAFLRAWLSARRASSGVTRP
jgi:N-acetyl-alpha-D-muramate 1-phosphate uridylyltransferase